MTPKTIRIQFKTADGITQYVRMPREVLKQRVIYRTCFKIIRLDGQERPGDSIDMMATKRAYVLWTQLQNGTFVFLEDQ